MLLGEFAPKFAELNDESTIRAGDGAERIKLSLRGPQPCDGDSTDGAGTDGLLISVSPDGSKKQWYYPD